MSIPYKCPICCGAGTIKLPPEIRQSMAYEPPPKTCHACAGQGIVWEPRDVRVYDDAGECVVVQPVFQYDVHGV